ncbi:aldolase [Jeotgalibacillus soli]|uniref:Aldolase n=1 Tax=Jeotgalibacillus soli TaxID=889306 RepID=A0A0C2RGS5_9BACL|nr:aldolase [Jeotgalibacillus soli]KIL49375.1 aldolase [Jeotgalibacillus soli]
MADRISKTIYKVFGLTVASDILMPELIQVYLESGNSDIAVEKEDLSRQWAEHAEANKYFYVEENLTMFQIPKVATFLIQNGNEILVSPMENTQEDQLRLYILGTCMGAILMQRKILPLHGSAIAIDGQAYAIVGASGAGKSTLASALLSKGYQLLSDDVIPVTLSEANIPIITPAYPQQKLWLESLNEFGMESDLYRPIIDRETKFAIPVEAHFVDEPMPLAGVFELIKTEADEVEIHSIQNMERFYTLFTHTYRNFFIAPSGLMEWHFSTSAKIINKIAMYQLRRPISRFTADDLSAVMLSSIEKRRVSS